MNIIRVHEGPFGVCGVLPGISRRSSYTNFCLEGCGILEEIRVLGQGGFPERQGERWLLIGMLLALLRHAGRGTVMRRAKPRSFGWICWNTFWDINRRNQLFEHHLPGGGFIDVWVRDKDGGDDENLYSYGAACR